MTTAVVLMAYGSPERLEDVPAYYADIRGGRPIRPELLDDLVDRYRRLGIDKGSPLNAITEQTRAALERELGGTTPVFTLSQDSSGGCDLRFRHEGLSPQLECYEMCRAGWDQYLPSLRDYIATGTGNPYTPARLG